MQWTGIGTRVSLRLLKCDDFILFMLDSSMSDEDAEAYSNVLHMLEPTADLLDLLRTYEGCAEYIRQVREREGKDNTIHPLPYAFCPPSPSFVRYLFNGHRFEVLDPTFSDPTHFHAHDTCFCFEPKPIGNVVFCFVFFSMLFSLHLWFVVCLLSVCCLLFNCNGSPFLEERTEGRKTRDRGRTGRQHRKRARVRE